MKKILHQLIMFGMIALIGQHAGLSQTYRLASPSKKTVVLVKVNDKKELVYKIEQQGKPIVDWSNMGLGLQKQVLGQQASILKQQKRSVNEMIQWRLGENAKIMNHYHELTLNCQSNSYPFQVIFRAFDSSIAFRYVLPKPTKNQVKVIKKEYTTFNLIQNFTLYQYNEESVFKPTLIDSLTKTSDFPSTLTHEKKYLSIGEADNRSYTKAELCKGMDPHSLGIAFRKDSVVFDREFTTPWRIISVASSAVELHQFSDLAFRLTTAYNDTIPNWIKPGKVLRLSLNTKDGLAGVDFAATHNFQYIMFDAGWYGAEFRTSSDPTQIIPELDLHQVIARGKEKGVGVILYVNKIGLLAHLDEILPLYKKWGVAGFKFGFIDGLSQKGITWLNSAIKKTLDYGFILNIHDNYKPTGLSHSYPNLLTQEGIRGNENAPDAFHNMVLPFTRYLAGAADYTYCYPNSVKSFSNKLLVSRGQQLALSVVYFSPLQAIFWYGNPADYKNEGEIEFFTHVPTVWDESRYLQGEIGQHISVARRKGTTWFVGTATGFNDWSGKLTLDFLSAGKKYKMSIYEDDENFKTIHKRVMTIQKNSAVLFNIKAKGGQAIILEEIK